MVMIRHIRNAGWAVAEGFCYPVLLLLATPVLLKSLGHENFGLWTLFITVTSIGMVIGIGLSPAIIKLVAQASTGSMRRIHRIASGGMAVAFIAGGALSIAVAFATLIFAFARFDTFSDSTLLVATGLFAALLLWIEQFDLVISSVIKGLEEFGLSAKLEIALKSTQVILLIVGAAVTHSLLIAFAAFLSVAMLRLAVKVIAIRRRLPGIKLLPRRRMAGAVLSYSKWGWIQGLGSVLFLSADRLVIGAVLGTVSLGYYSIAVQLVSQLHALIANASSILMPRVSQNEGRKVGAGAHSLQRQLVLVNAGVSLAGAALMWFVGPTLLKIWVGEEISHHIEHSFFILVVGYFVLSLCIVPFHILTGIGRMRFIALTCVLGGVATLLMALFFVPFAGMEGAAISRLGYAVVSLALFYPLALTWRHKRGETLTEPKVSGLDAI